MQQAAASAVDITAAASAAVKQQQLHRGRECHPPAEQRHPTNISCTCFINLLQSSPKWAQHISMACNETMTQCHTTGVGCLCMLFQLERYKVFH
jgi:hypothetical protein